MGMFLNYHNIADNYMPNNLINAFPTKDKCSKLDPIEASKPYEEYDAKGELEGYFWRYGDTLNLEFNIDGEITIESDAIISTTKGQYPTERTIGKIGQRFYNVADMKSFTCVAQYSHGYYWEEDRVFTYPTSASKSVYISADSYLSNKQVEVTIYNFRLEPICKKVFGGAPTIRFFIDKELSNALVKGVYYCSLRVYDEITNTVVFEPSDCKLLVK